MITKDFLTFNNQPYAFLEGGLGLNDEEQKMANVCYKSGVEMYILEELYDVPNKIAALKFLKPKTLIIGTTGVYKEKLDHLIDVFIAMEISSVENLVLMHDSYIPMKEGIKKYKKFNPNLKVYTPKGVVWGEEDARKLILIEKV